MALYQCDILDNRLQVFLVFNPILYDEHCHPNDYRIEFQLVFQLFLSPLKDFHLLMKKILGAVL